MSTPSPVPLLVAVTCAAGVISYTVFRCIATYVRLRRRRERMTQERKDRGLGQTMYLIEIERNGLSGWDIVVEGSTGISYRVFLGPDGCSCTCPDFLARNKVCKHIYFVIGRVAKMPKFLRSMKSTPSKFRITNEVYDAIQLATDRQPRSASSDPGLDSVGDELGDCECCICFEPLVGSVTLDCPCCKKHIHWDCMDRWWSKGRKTCPMCRGSFPRRGFVSNDCFYKFRARQLENAANHLLTFEDVL